MDYGHIGQHESDPRTEESVPLKAATGQNIPIDEPGCAKDAEDGALKQKATVNYELFYGLPRGSCTMEQVVDSSAGVEGWFEYTGPGIRHEPSPYRTLGPSQRSRGRRCSEKPSGN